jgi:GH3 auxin-responsive promoter
MCDGRLRADGRSGLDCFNTLENAMRRPWFDYATAEFGRVALLPFYQNKLQRYAKSFATAEDRRTRFLLRRIAECADTDFGVRHSFRKITTVADFQNAVPAGDFSYLKPYMDRLAAGDVQALLPAHDRIRAFACTTGTTGAPKWLPATQSWLRNYNNAWRLWGAKCITDHPNIIGSKWLQISGPMNVDRTPSGMTVGMASAITARLQHPIFNVYYATPATLGDIDDPEDKYYAILRLAMPQDIGFIMTLTAANLIRLA